MISIKSFDHQIPLVLTSSSLQAHLCECISANSSLRAHPCLSLLTPVSLSLLTRPCWSLLTHPCWSMLIAPLIRTEAGGESEAIRWKELRFRTNPGVQVTDALLRKGFCSRNSASLKYRPFGLLFLSRGSTHRSRLKAREYYSEWYCQSLSRGQYQTDYIRLTVSNPQRVSKHLI